MLVELPIWVIVILNMVAVPCIHLGLSWFYTRLPSSWFKPESFLFRLRMWEKAGAFYQSVFAIRTWKGMLPDAAPWFDGFAKGNFKTKERSYIDRFIVETCRSEGAHYAQLIGLLITVIWNPWPTAGIIMISYAFLSNLPCVLLQRFTRARLRRLLAKLDSIENNGP